MKVYKYGTGQKVPEGAIYLTTVVEVDNVHRYVWHYFLIDRKEKLNYGEKDGDFKGSG